MGNTGYWVQAGLAAAIAATAGTTAQASVVLGTAQGSITAASATETSSSGKPQRAQWDLATMKGARSAAPSQPIVITLEKVNIQDLHFVCSSKSAARAAGGGVTAVDDWQTRACTVASATVIDGGKTYELTDVSLAVRPATGCDGACGPDVTNVQVSFMAINEKGSSGNNGTVKKSPK